ncbi:MAG: TIGR03118 family protein [Terriglobia bacterium]
MKLCSAGALTIVLLSSGLLFSDSLYQTNLVSDISGLALNTDAHLKDAWGMSFSATSPIWVSDRASGVATVYSGSGTIEPLVVTVPPGTAQTGPTGQVFAGPATSFTLNGGPAAFIFDTLGGTVDAWAGGTTATVVATTAGARYEGLALANNTLFAANFVSGGGINMFNSSYASTGNFNDPNIPSGYAPYNVQSINGKLYVEYAKVNPNSAIPIAPSGAGGYVDVFDTNGHLLQRLIANGPLDAPWGVALAPDGFGSFGGDLLIGNFGNGEINAFDPTTGNWLGTLTGTSGQPFVDSGLWAIAFGNSSANANALYFTAGINSGNDGLFGNIQATPEPGDFGLAFLGIMGLLGYAWQRRSKARHASPFLH